MVDSGNKALKAAGITADELDLVVPHQANTRIIESALSKLNIPMEKASLVLEHTGNTSSASIPLALVDALEKGRVKEGDLILLGASDGHAVASAVCGGRALMGRVVLVTGGALALAWRARSALPPWVQVAVTYHSSPPPKASRRQMHSHPGRVDEASRCIESGSDR